MAERTIDSLDGIDPDSERQNAQRGDAGKAMAVRPVVPPPAPKAPPPTVELNYPEPTFLAQVIKDVARWSGLAFVMEPTVNTKIQIFAPRKLTPTEAYDLFLASLAVVGLRAVQMGQVVKIVPVTFSVSA